MGFFKKLFGKNKEEDPVVSNNLQEDESSDSPKFSLDDMNDSMFIHLESKYRHQPFVLRRSSENDRITLGEVLHEVFQIEPDDLQSLAVVASNTMVHVIETSTIVDKEEISKFDLFACILKNKLDGHYTQGMSNDAVLIVQTKSQEIALNITSLGGSPEMKYIRIVLLAPDNAEKDDLRTTQSENAPFVSSFVLSFVEDGYETSLKHFEAVEKGLIAKQQNGEELDDLEREMVHGQLEFQGYGYIGYGKWLFEQSRYYDTYSILKRAYNYMKANIHNAPEDVKEAFYEICALLGICLSKLGREEEAFFFFRVARDGGKVGYCTNYIDSMARLGNASAMWLAMNNMVHTYASVYGENPDTWPEEARDYPIKVSFDLIKYKQLFDSKLEECPRIDTGITIGELLDSLYGVKRYDVLPNMAVFNQIEGKFEDTIEDKDKVYDYLLNADNCFDKTFVLSLSHSPNESKDNGDKSILSSFATLIIVTHKVKAEKEANLMRLDIIRGNYPNNDDRREPVRANVPLFTSLIMGTKSDNTFGANKDECIECFQFADDLHSQNRFLEASKLYKWVFENASNLMKTDMGKAYNTEDRELLGLFFEAAFNAGFCLMELGAMESSSYYLSQAVHSNLYAHAQEYINCLVNTKAPIALDVINEVLSRSTKPDSEEDMQAWKYHMAFLKRRKSYALIDMREYDEAEELLKEMVNDPLCKDFAEGELNYINDIRNK
jgi:hypothetical protein